ncbi:methyltransferase domain-containing protein [Leptospira sp. 96542]|nr:methyltransferase domain-containing protein [Leptospira sp. 96542]
MKQTQNKNTKDVITIAKDYYNSPDADFFYEEVWGGEDIHIGIYTDDKISIKDASRNTINLMLGQLKTPITKETKILDIGSGYGGAARFIAKEYGANITCLNLSETENNLNRKKNYELGIDSNIQVLEGNFEELPFDPSSFDIVWSEDAILHSPNKEQVFFEVDRVLKSGGEFIFTDPMQSSNCPEGSLRSIYDRIHLDNLGSVSLYNSLAEKLLWENFGFLNLSENIAKHYSAVRKTIEEEKVLLVLKISNEFLERMSKGLGHWIVGGEKGYLEWGILHFRKP